MELIGYARTDSQRHVVRHSAPEARPFGGILGEVRSRSRFGRDEASDRAPPHHAAAITSSMRDAVSVQSLTARVGMPSASTG